MKTTNYLTINGITTDGPAYYEAIGLAKCLAAYAENGCSDILEIGFNPNSGYTYIALEGGVTICSLLGRDVEYLVTDFETGEESFFDSIEAADDFMFNLNS